MTMMTDNRTLVDRQIEWDKAFRDKGHHPITNDDGQLDYFAYNPQDPHNGPRCLTCGYGICWHCHDIDDITECIHARTSY